MGHQKKEVVIKRRVFFINFLQTTKSYMSSGSKKSFRTYLKDLHERGQRHFTSCQNSTAFRKCCFLKLTNLVGSLIDKYEKSKIQDILCKSRGHNFCLILLKFAPEHRNRKTICSTFFIFLKLTD